MISAMKSATSILQRRRGSCQGCGAETELQTPDGKLFQCEQCEACVPVPVGTTDKTVLIKEAPHVHP